MRVYSVAHFYGDTIVSVGKLIEEAAVEFVAELFGDAPDFGEAYDRWWGWLRPCKAGDCRVFSECSLARNQSSPKHEIAYVSIVRTTVNDLYKNNRRVWVRVDIQARSVSIATKEQVEALGSSHHIPRSTADRSAVVEWLKVEAAGLVVYPAECRTA